MSNQTQEEYGEATVTAFQSIQLSGATGRPVGAGPIKKVWAPWTAETISTMLQMAQEGHSCSQIAIAVRRTRNAVIGKLHRMGIHKAYPQHVAKRVHTKKVTPSLPRVAPLEARSPLPLIRKAKPAVTPKPVEPGFGRFELVSLNAGQCRFAVSSHRHEHLFCGAPVIGNTSWCEEHARRVYQPLTRAKGVGG